jgi:phosphoribosyl 1,2-cyclic phosphodiesterase
LGGNTTCIEVLHDGPRRIIIDAGSGIANLGDAIHVTGAVDREVHLFFTHYHWDHICGLPFFSPIYSPDFVIHLYGLNAHKGELEDMVKFSLHPPYSPIYSPEYLPSTLQYQADAEAYQIDGVRIRPYQLEETHAGGVWLLDIAQGENHFVIATDFEVVTEEAQEAVVPIYQGADFVMSDCHFSDKEYREKMGWGHATYRKAAGLAQLTGVTRILGTHHGPFASDAEIAAEREHVGADFPHIQFESAAEGSEYFAQ